jgi:hypothetical protein
LRGRALTEFIPRACLRYPSSMSSTTDSAREPVRPGLCSDCLHARQLESARGSVFLLCNLSLTDPRFPKYPRLPVLSCDGYQKNLARPMA